MAEEDFSRHTHKNGALLQHYCYDSIHPDGVKLQAPRLELSVKCHWWRKQSNWSPHKIFFTISASRHLAHHHCSCSTAARRNEKWHSYHLGHFQYFSPTVVAAYAEWQFWSKLTVRSKFHRRIWNLNLQLLLLAADSSSICPNVVVVVCCR